MSLAANSDSDEEAYLDSDEEDTREDSRRRLRRRLDFFVMDRRRRNANFAFIRLSTLIYFNHFDVTYYYRNCKQWRSVSSLNLVIGSMDNEHFDKYFRFTPTEIKDHLLGKLDIPVVVPNCNRYRIRGEVGFLMLLMR